MEVKAAVLREFNKPVSIETLELADPKANEVMVKVAAVGFCHSDLHVFYGEIPVPLPIVLGHETAGIVEKVGPGVTKVKPGDHVVCCWMVPCGKCFQCFNGRPNLCEGHFPQFLGGQLLDGTSRLTDKEGKPVGQAFFISGFSTYTVVPEDGALPIRKDFPLEYACSLGCCVPTGWGAVVNVANVKAGTSVAVYGCGGVGLNVIRAASLRHANPIIAVDLEGNREEIAREFGATHFINSSKEDPVPKIMELTGGAGAEYVFEAIGDPGAIIQAYWSLRMGGRLILPGITPAEATTNLPLMLVPLHERAIIGTLYGGIKPQIDIPKLVDLAAEGAFKLDKLVSKKIKLEQINEAAEAMHHRNIVGRWIIMME
jgi:S-(hydroxymethyl)glutathione dehydrogenase/alcohol dehydrogenase